ncbi:MAG: HNH endonuclease, partial [Bacteriovorax sp.]|nr:HNH endonuclease [Bacteriovorax sp.]
FIYRFLRSIYFNWIYPIVQAFKRKNEFGYVLSKGGEFEHRAVVQKIIKRSLDYGEEVHHINGKTWDNRRANLALMTRQNHIRWHSRLNWMYERKIFPKIRWQRQKLVREFEARLF